MLDEDFTELLLGGVFRSVLVIDEHRIAVCLGDKLIAFGSS